MEYKKTESDGVGLRFLLGGSDSYYFRIMGSEAVPLLLNILTM